MASSIAIDSRVKDQIGRPVSHVYRPRSRSAWKIQRAEESLSLSRNSQEVLIRAINASVAGVAASRTLQIPKKHRYTHPLFLFERESSKERERERKSVPQRLLHEASFALDLSKPEPESSPLITATPFLTAVENYRGSSHNCIKSKMLREEREMLWTGLATVTGSSG